MSVILGPLPCSVDVAGEKVPVRCGWRENVLADREDRDAPDGRLAILTILLGRDDGSLPDIVARNAADAFAAVVAWHDGSVGCMRYGVPGTGAGRAPRRVLDWEEDSAIIYADFMRFYRIDLAESSLHWYRFCALVAALSRTEGSLVGEAMYARSDHPGAKGAEKRRLSSLAASWALPPTDAELRELAKARFEQ